MRAHDLNKHLKHPKALQKQHQLPSHSIPSLPWSQPLGWISCAPFQRDALHGPPHTKIVLFSSLRQRGGTFYIQTCPGFYHLALCLPICRNWHSQFQTAGHTGCCQPFTTTVFLCQITLLGLFCAPVSISAGCLPELDPPSPGICGFDFGRYKGHFFLICQPWLGLNIPGAFCVQVLGGG